MNIDKALVAVLTLWVMMATSGHGQTQFEYHGMTLKTHPHRLLVDGKHSDAGNFHFRTPREALDYAANKAQSDTTWTEIYLQPDVYWMDDPDDPAIRTPQKGATTPFAMEVKVNRLHLIGMGNRAEDVVLAVNRGQTQGADGNYTMFHFVGNDFRAEHITFGNYCNIDLVYPRNPRLNRPRRKDAIVQAQLAICQGDRYSLADCRFLSRLNLCPFVGAPHTTFDNCYFECTDDALCGSGHYRHCRFTLYSSKPFYTTDRPHGAIFTDCDLHSKTQGTQYLTKMSGPVEMHNCRWTSDDPHLQIAWNKRPDPNHRCVATGCTLNGQPLELPQPTDPLPVSLPPFAVAIQTDIMPGRWTLDCHKPLDTACRDWIADNTHSSWGYGEGTDGAEGIWGLVPLQKGARMMFTPIDEATPVRNQECSVVMTPCKSGGQGFGSATTQYLDLCIKFDTRHLTGYGIRFERTPDYDHAVEVSLVEYADGQVSHLTTPTRCDLFRGTITVTLRAEGTRLNALIQHQGDTSTTAERGQEDKETVKYMPLTATMPHPNPYGGFHLQHTGSTGASAIVIQTIRMQ